MTRSIRIGLLANFLAAVVAHGAQAPAVDSSTQVLATVNGAELTLEDLEGSLEEIHGSVVESARGGGGLDRLLFKAVNDALIGQEARALGLDRDSSVSDKVEGYRRKLALDRLERDEITSRAEPGEADIESVFEELYRRVSFQIITVREPEAAEQILAELRAGGDMDQLALERSVDFYKLRSGRVQDVARRELQRDIGDLVFGIEPGELAGPLPTDMGWSVIRVNRLESADRERFAELRSTLEALARQRQVAILRRDLAAALRQRYPVSIDRELVALMEPQPRSDGRLVPANPRPEAIVARVGESVELTAGEYAEALERRWNEVRNQAAASAAAPIILDGLIDGRLFLAEARARGYHETPEVNRQVRAFETRLLVPRYLEEVLAERVEVTDNEMTAFFEQNKSRFRRPPKVLLGQVTTATREAAEQAAELLRRGSDLAWVAKKSSMDRFRDSGGNRGWYEVEPGLPDFNQQLLEAEPGDVLGPFEQGESWVVLTILDRAEQGFYDFAQVSGNVREAVFASKFASALHAFITTLRERSEIEINEAAMASLRISGAPEEPSGKQGASPHGH